MYYVLVGFKVQRGWELKGTKKVWIEKAKEQRLEIYIMCIIKVTKLFYQRAPWIVRCFGHKHPIASSFCNIGALFRTSLWTVSTQLTTMVSYGIWIKPKKKSHPCVIHVPSTLHDVPRSHWWSAFDPWCLLKCKWRSFIFRNYTPFLTEGCSAYPYGGYYVFKKKMKYKPRW